MKKGQRLAEDRFDRIWSKFVLNRLKPDHNIIGVTLNVIWNYDPIFYTKYEFIN